MRFTLLDTIHIYIYSNTYISCIKKLMLGIRKAVQLITKNMKKFEVEKARKEKKKNRITNNQNVVTNFRKMILGKPTRAFV